MNEWMHVSKILREKKSVSKSLLTRLVFNKIFELSVIVFSLDLACEH